MTTRTATDSVGPLGADAFELANALLHGEVPIAIYGLGKVGLPMAAVYAHRTGNVIGVDIDQHRVDQINQGQTPFSHEPGLDSLLESAIKTNELSATTDASTASETARVHIIIVPVMLSQRPTDATASNDGYVKHRGELADLTALDAAVRSVGNGLTRGDLVILESTVPPGTTDSMVTPLLERISGLERGTFGVAFSPERVSSGRAITDISGAYPRVVGGIDAASTNAASGVYRGLTDSKVITVTDARTAEVVKLFEGIYRDVNIALANELARTTDDLRVDVREAISAANTQPYCDIHTPGAGVGGHCIPVYPHLFSQAVEADTPLIQMARYVNDGMPMFVVSKLVNEFKSIGKELTETTVGVLGLTYRPGIPELRNSPAEPIITSLIDDGVSVVGVDPALDDPDVFGVPRVEPEMLQGLNPDGVIIVTNHEAFSEIEWSGYDDLIIVDARDILTQTMHRTYTIGRGYR